ncbi:hypothetical protein BE11_32715, partial [Sorangium cellulosum]
IAALRFGAAIDDRRALLRLRILQQPGCAMPAACERMRLRDDVRLAGCVRTAREENQWYREVQ